MARESHSDARRLSDNFKKNKNKQTFKKQKKKAKLLDEVLVLVKACANRQWHSGGGAGHTTATRYLSLRRLVLGLQAGGWGGGGGGAREGIIFYL